MKISLIAFGRPADKLLLGSWSSDKQGPAKDDERMGTVRKLLVAAKKRLGPSGRQKLVWNESNVYCTVDSSIKHAFIVIVEEGEEESTRNSGPRFVEECAYRLLGALNRAVSEEPEMAKKCDECKEAEGMSEELKETFANLAEEYGSMTMPERGASRANKSGSPESEKLGVSGFVGSVKSSRYGTIGDEDSRVNGLRNKVSGIKKEVKSNMDAMIRGLEDVDQAEEETALLLDEAEDYEESAEKTEKYFWLKSMKMRAIMGITAAVLLGTCVYCTMGGQSKKGDEDGAQK